ncbi:hypothetical protein [Fictibacillus sp. NRS-1165]|uniref:hypothetical protein n=1 Tax=Fictibacillus sp. NRS-1165 TaxID=3144463 RepID=UPI003D22B52C
MIRSIKFWAGCIVLAALVGSSLVHQMVFDSKIKKVPVLSRLALNNLHLLMKKGHSASFCFFGLIALGQVITFLHTSPYLVYYPV